MYRGKVSPTDAPLTISLKYFYPCMGIGANAQGLLQKCGCMYFGGFVNIMILRDSSISVEKLTLFNYEAWEDLTWPLRIHF